MRCKEEDEGTFGGVVRHALRCSRLERNRAHHRLLLYSLGAGQASTPPVTSCCVFVLKARWSRRKARSTAQTQMVSEGQLTVQAVPLRENAAGLELVTPFQVPLKPNPV